MVHFRIELSNQLRILKKLSGGFNIYEKKTIFIDIIDTFIKKAIF